MVTNRLSTSCLWMLSILLWFFFFFWHSFTFPSPVHSRQSLPTLNCNKKTPFPIKFPPSNKKTSCGHPLSSKTYLRGLGPRKSTLFRKYSSKNVLVFFFLLNGRLGKKRCWVESQNFFQRGRKGMCSCYTNKIYFKEWNEWNNTCNSQYNAGMQNFRNSSTQFWH